MSSLGLCGHFVLSTLFGAQLKQFVFETNWVQDLYFQLRWVAPLLSLSVACGIRCAIGGWTRGFGLSLSVWSKHCRGNQVLYVRVAEAGFRTAYQRVDRSKGIWSWETGERLRKTGSRLRNISTTDSRLKKTCSRLRKT